MPVDHKEKAFESAIEHHLIASGYAKAEQGLFDQERALDATQFVPFVKETQRDTWKKLEKLLGSRTEEVLVDDLCKAMDSRGCLDVIRHGFKCYGEPVKVAYFAPAHRVKSGHRFIEDHDSRVVQNRLCNAYALQHALGELLQALVTMGAKANYFNQSRNALAQLVLGDTAQTAVQMEELDRRKPFIKSEVFG